jgi:hypothetical protein
MGDGHPDPTRAQNPIDSPFYRCAMRRFAANVSTKSLGSGIRVGLDSAVA